jgi:AcrR family transcriptional regulator
MARPLTQEKRNAILRAAVEVVAMEGVGASTAKIAKKAGVAEGTLFTYFANKDALLNQLYIELKTELGNAMAKRFPTGTSLGRTWLRLGDHKEGQRLLQEALAGGSAPTDLPGYRDALRQLYEACLDTEDWTGAASWHEMLVASGDAHGTSYMEVEARQAERADPARAVSLYQRVIEPQPPAQVRSSTLMRVSFRLAASTLKGVQSKRRSAWSVPSMRCFTSCGTRTTRSFPIV